MIYTAIPSAATMNMKRRTQLSRPFAPACALRAEGLAALTQFRATALVIALLGLLMGSSATQALDLNPGLYEIEVRIALPNVQNVAAPITITQCISADDLRSGRAFFVLSDNPLQTCELVDYRAAENTFSYRMVCPGPNRGSAFAEFETTPKTYRGAIQMNMGGKNMTMSETQLGKRVGDCP